MNSYTLTHLCDTVLLSDLLRLVTQDRATTAELLAHIAEVDERRLYLPAAYPSMHAYCVHELHLAEDAAYKRIQAARTARRFPTVFELLASGRLHLGGVCLLTPHLTEGNARELFESSIHKTKAEIEQLLACRFPRTELLELVQVIPVPSRDGDQLAPGQVQGIVQPHVGGNESQLAPGQVDRAESRTTLAPIASQRFALQVTVDQSTYDDLRHAQELLGHLVPSGDVASVLGMALRSFVRALEKRKFAATDRPHGKLRRSAGVRTIPAHVRRAVWERDQGQCSFVSESGNRCSSRTRLEFDHVHEVARGGEASVDQIRLRCRPHNQFTAERTFGAGFMQRKREEARHAAGARKAEAEVRKAEALARRAAAQALAAEARNAEALARKSAAEARIAGASARKTAAEERAKAHEDEKRVDDRNVIPWLRHLGFRDEEARRAAAHCESLPHASLETRLRAALSFLRPRCRATG